MRLFPGIVLLLLAGGIYFYNGQEDVKALNIPFLSALPGVETRADRGRATWQVLAGLGGAWIVGVGVIAMLKPREERVPTNPRDRMF
jgi:hypothetical protein